MSLEIFKCQWPLQNIFKNPDWTEKNAVNSKGNICK